MKNLTELYSKIELLRTRMNRCIMTNGINSEKSIHLSKRLDVLILECQKQTSKKSFKSIRVGKEMSLYDKRKEQQSIQKMRFQSLKKNEEWTCHRCGTTHYLGTICLKCEGICFKILIDDL